MSSTTAISFPQPLPAAGRIGVFAPSRGAVGDRVAVLDRGLGRLVDRGYGVVEAPGLRSMVKQAAGSPAKRAAEFVDLYADPAVDALMAAMGGWRLLDMLPHLDFDRLRRCPPKWVVGFSDVSKLLIALTTEVGVATLHGPNVHCLGAARNAAELDVAMAVLEALGRGRGATIDQAQAARYWPREAGSGPLPDDDPGRPVRWRIVNGSGNVRLRGRLLGGLTTGLARLCGTACAPVAAFADRHQGDGLVWYFEDVNEDAGDLYLAYEQMRMSGWFRHVRGILVGRLAGYRDNRDFTHDDALLAVFGDLEVPIVCDLDIGHEGAQASLVNGALAEVSLVNGEGRIEQRLL